VKAVDDVDAGKLDIADHVGGGFLADLQSLCEIKPDDAAAERDVTDAGGLQAQTDRFPVYLGATPEIAPGLRVVQVRLDDQCIVPGAHEAILDSHVL
jgi:hypothetical protein